MSFGIALILSIAMAFVTLAIEVIEGRVSPSTLLPVSGDIAEGEVTPIADFAIEDVNESSATFGTQVSPRDYLNSVSAWYFGHST